jgi:hypothetical protein
MKLRRLLALLIPVAAAMTACDDDLLEDATFRMWCSEDRLCAWNVDTGHIRRAATWHKNDPGVELVDTPTAISQVTDKTSRCLKFTTIADVEASAQVTVGIDFDDDGSIDYEQPISAVGFHPVETQVTAPVRYTGFRVVVTKKGDGRAVLAQMRIQSSGDCTAPPLRLRDRLLGSPCSQGDPNECRSGVCCEGVCAECCVDPKLLDMASDGGAAIVNGESAVKPPIVQCPDGQTCKRREALASTLFFATVPLQCDPGMRKRPAGAVCLADDDCTSGACDGADVDAVVPLRDASCEPDFPDAGGGDCMITKVREGRCL